MRFKNTHNWDLSPVKAIELQNQLKTRIRLRKLTCMPRLIAGADAAFKKNKASGAVVVVTFPEFKLIESIRKLSRISYPYIPGLLTFREGPVLERCFKELKNKPDVVIFDGQGLAHPRNMGLATHMGILLDRPTIGCAKTRLFGKYIEPKESRGSFSYLLDNQGKRIGVVLRTRDKVRPVYVSPGHKIDLADCIKIILQCTRRFRIPEPLRLAHHLTKNRDSDHFCRK